MTFCETFPPDHFPIYFYREPKAPDLEIYPDELDYDAIKDARLFWASLGGLSKEPSRSATLAALAVARPRAPDRCSTSTTDRRSGSSREDAHDCALQALAHVTIAVGNLGEVEVAVGTAGPDFAADRLLDMGVQLAVVKLGPEGVLAKTREERVEVLPTPIDVVNGLGAGDGFGGALCHGVLSGLEPGRDDSIRQCRGRHRGVTTLVLRGHAHERRGTNTAGRSASMNEDAAQPLVGVEVHAA